MVGGADRHTGGRGSAYTGAACGVSGMFGRRRGRSHVFRGARERDPRAGGALGSGRVAGARHPHAEHPRRSGRRAGRLFPPYRRRSLRGGCLALDPRYPAAIPAQRRRQGNHRKPQEGAVRRGLPLRPGARLYGQRPGLAVLGSPGVHRDRFPSGDYVGFELEKPCIVLRASLDQ